MDLISIPNLILSSLFFQTKDMAHCLPPLGPENCTLGLAGYGSLNLEPSQTERTVPPVSRQLSFPQTELHIALAEQKCQVAVIALLQQRLEDRDGGVAATPTHFHPVKPSQPKKAHKRSRKSRHAQQPK